RVTAWLIGQPDLTVLAARQEDGGVPGRGGLPTLVLAPDVEVHRGPVAVDEVAPGHAAAHPVRVADVVELGDCAVDLQGQCIVAHQVGPQVHEPRLAHAAVVVRLRVAKS